MIVEYTRYKIDADRQNKFLADYKLAAESLGASKHCVCYELTQCTEDPEQFILRLEWDSAEGHLKGFRSSPELSSVFIYVRPYVNDIEEMRHYRLTDIGGEGGGSGQALASL